MVESHARAATHLATSKATRANTNPTASVSLGTGRAGVFMDPPARANRHGHDRSKAVHTMGDNARGPGGNIDSCLLGIYLNDHLAGACAGVQRARHLADATSGTPLGRAMSPIAAEIAQDRASLLAIMRQLDLPVRRYKAWAGWLGESFGRLKTNGRLLRRSPLTTYLELELLRTAVEGKTAGWQTLRRLAESHQLLDPAPLDELLQRAERQQHTLELWRRRQTAAGFTAG
ncbi:hypothetical protein ACFXPX_16055 [Kitasatospora sp. NPDC059146]|uniref:hypothetical protein n=1 Tax=unclassified Kitasatospora TaxID=2633591 RepID=UPI0036AF5B19